MPQHNDGPVWREYQEIRCEICHVDQDDTSDGPMVCANCDAIVGECCFDSHALECWGDAAREQLEAAATAAGRT